MRNCFFLALVALAMSMHFGVIAQETATRTPERAAGQRGLEDEFDLDFLNPAVADKAEAAALVSAGRVPSGRFAVALEINDASVGSMNIQFVRRARDENAQPCFSTKDIQAFKLRPEFLTEAATALGPGCLPIGAIVEQASYTYDRDDLRLKITVPQAALQKVTQERASPASFVDGEDAGFVNYYFNSYQTYGQGAGTSSQFLDLKSGLNWQTWQLRQQSLFAASDGGGLTQINGDLSVRKVFRAWKMAAAFGNISSQTPLISGVSMQGLSINSEEGLMPPQEKIYNPAIRGFARSNARIQARQNGILFLEKNVPPGPFEFDALNPPASTGDIQVTVTEADGSQQFFVMPYASSWGKLRPGAFRYLVNYGFYGYQTDAQQAVLQASFRYGLWDNFTGALDVFWSERYQSYATQFDFENMVGAQLLQVNMARYAANHNEATWSLRYQDRLAVTKFASLSYSLSAATEKYLEAAQALSYAAADPKASVGAKLSQALSAGVDLGAWGALGLTHSVQSSGSSVGASQSTYLSYGKTWGRASLSVSLSRSTGNGLGGDAGANTALYLGLNLPISIGPGNANLSSSWSQQSNAASTRNINYQNTLDDGLTYGVGVSDSNAHNVASANVQVAHDWGFANASASQSSRGEGQWGFGNNGALIFHRAGVLAAPPVGDTFAIVEVSDGAGARVQGQSARIGSQGFGVAQYLSPYTDNTVQISLDGAPLELEIATPVQNVAPMAGAIVALKYASSTGRPLLVDFQPLAVKKIPLGAEVSDEDGDVVGMVGQGARALLRVRKPKGLLKIAWGPQADEQCQARYEIQSQDKPNAAGLIKFLLKCQ